MRKPKTPKPDTRPRIWSEGRQHPPLDARAFLRASVALTREAQAGMLDRVSGQTAKLAADVAAGWGRIPPDRLGRTGRFLPDHRRVAAALDRVAAAMRRGARLAAGETDAPEPTLFDAAPRSVAETQTLARTPPRTTDRSADPDLLAIRGLLAATAEPAVAPHRLPPLSAPEPALRRDGLAVRTLALVLGYGLMPLLLPWGAGRAVLAHLNGQDLGQSRA